MSTTMTAEGIGHGNLRKQPALRAAKWVLIVLVVLVVLFYGGGGWYFSNKLFTLGLSGAARRSLKPNFDLPVESVTSSSIVLDLSSSTPYEATSKGTWGLEWPTGYGQITTIEDLTSKSVKRAFNLMTGVEPKPGQKVAIDSEAFPNNPKTAFGINYQSGYYKGPLGNYPFWYIPGTSSTWAITVHGNAMTLLDGMKAVPTLHSMGLPTLMITYRNDPGAPQSKSDMLRYGLTEWQDLQAAVGYALSHGAQHLVLLGYSMGGGIVTNFLLQSKLASKVSAVVLDAPMEDFSATVNFDASEMSLPLVGIALPQSLTDVAKLISSWRYGVAWSKLDYLNEVKRLHTPILLFQGLADQTVPPASSSALAHDLPDLVTYVTTPGAGHLESWNFNPQRYDSIMSSFIQAHLS
ncbi:MAG: alpha/beta fold hydrolase [Actinomycetota bacterium]|nr:alpha/beta fold hydrolase [Actinomycetota bacterium]